MPSIDPRVISYHLAVNPTSKAIQKKQWVFNQDRKVAIKVEVDKLIKAGFIREVYYPNWVANVVMVIKANGK